MYWHTTLSANSKPPAASCSHDVSCSKITAHNDIGIAQLVEHWTHDWKVAEAAGEFSSQESTFCADAYLVSVPPRVTAVASKRPWSFCHKFRWQVVPQSGMTTLSRHSVRTYQWNKLMHARQGTLNHNHFSSLSHSGLTLAYRVKLVWWANHWGRKKKKDQARTDSSETFLQNPQFV